MSDTLLRLYHGAPYPLRSLIASARGYYLRWWRYGPETDHLVEAALEREGWSQARWRVWQAERLAHILHRAATKVPFYREHWLQRRRRGDRASWEVLENWPILKKATLREQPAAFVADDCDIRRMYHEHTSGTTGKPISLWISRETLKHWYALFEARIRRSHTMSRHDRWAMLGGQLVTPFKQTRPPFWVWNAGLNQLYMSTYHLAPGNITAYIEAMHRYQVSYIFGYASAMYTLAQLVQQRGVQPPSMRMVTSNAEPLYSYQRQTIERVFQCSVYDTYGMAEMVSAANECSNGAMHIWPEVGIIEVMHDDTDILLSPEHEGRFICTGLLNADMPLIRYELGDRGALGAQEARCTCGRTLPLLKTIDGRSSDIVVTPDGRRIWGECVNIVFDESYFHLHEAQIIQETMDRLRVRFVPTAEYTRQDGMSIIHGLRQRVGDMSIILEPVDYIPRSANGKFHAVLSNVEHTE
jgi:phenylacetate-CoA ligase